MYIPIKMHSISIKKEVLKELLIPSEVLVAEELYKFLSNSSKKETRFKPHRVYPLIIRNAEDETVQYERFLEICEIFESKGLLRQGFFLQMDEDRTKEVALNQEQASMLNSNTSFLFRHNKKEYLSWESISSQYVLTDNLEPTLKGTTYSKLQLLDALIEITPRHIFEEAQIIARTRAFEKLNNSND